MPPEVRRLPGSDAHFVFMPSFFAIFGKRSPRDGTGPLSVPLWRATLRNWLVLDLCALVPLWMLALGWIPDQLRISISDGADSFVAVQTESGDLPDTTRYGTPNPLLWHAHLPRELSVPRLSIRISGDKGKEAIRRIELQKWLLLSFELDMDRLELRDAATQTYAFGSVRVARVRLASRTMALALLALQVILLGVAWVAARRRPAVSLRPFFVPALSAALVFALVWHVLLPLQTFWGNLSSFGFSLAELLPSLALRFAAAAVAGTVALTLLAACFGIWIPWCVLAAALGFHLEAGLLSGGIPALDGNWLFYANRFRIAWDSLAWIVLLAAAFTLRRAPRKVLPVAAALLSLWMLLSLLDVRRERPADSSNLAVTDFIPLDDVPETLSYSPRRNILVFIIDSLECAQAHAAVNDPEAGPSLREAFSGFTEFAGNFGAESSSGYSVANMFTGHFFEEGSSIPDFFMSVYSADSVLGDFLDAGWGVHLATTSISHGFSNHPRRDDAPPPPPSPAESLPPPDRPMQGALSWSLADICRVRAMPFAFRFHYLCTLSRDLPPYAVAREWMLYPRLAAAPVDPDSPGTLLFVHTDGVHIPVMYDRLGNLLSTDRNTDEGCAGMAVFLFRRLAELFDVYRAMGIYDDALILVLADHGNYVNNARTLPDPVSSPVPGNARPFLWVKPPRAGHPFATSSAPTSHARISSLLRESLRAPVSADALPALLSMDERRYQRIPSLGTPVEEWRIAPDGSCTLDGAPVSAPRH